MDEGLTRLVASLPTDEAESKGETWSAFSLMVASKARLLILPASLPCLLVVLKAAGCNHNPVTDVSASAWHITADRANYICVSSAQVKGCWCAGKEAVTQGRNSLAAKLAASPVWLSLTLDAETFPTTGKQVLADLPGC